MVAFLVFLSIIGILFVKFLYSLIFKGYNDQRASKGYKASWYGKDPPPTLNDGSQDDVSIHPFKIDIPSEVIEDLKNRLQRTRFEEPVEDSKFHYGFNPKYLKTVLEYWRSQYDWRKQEAELNRFPQFKTRIEGINVHFLHIKPPLLQESTVLMPGSAKSFKTLRGPFGDKISFFFKVVIGVHIFPLSWPDIIHQGKKEIYSFPLKKKIGMLLEEGGYFHIQATKPDTLGCGMADSPAGVAAYLLEKFGISTDSQALNLDNGALTKKFTLDELLTNVMMYWVNNNFTAAARFYKENVRNVFSGRNEKAPVTVPSGVAVFPNEVLMVPKTMMSQQMKNIVSYSIMPRGGHFAALEEPQLLADDIFKFVAIVERKDNSSQ
ncbi:Epoxide hydrolase 1 like protein [Argiope bruennichi]|uniref:Epoxide hydrolase n=1 Tax=Argiope bruennichi TaxID=94029 RepID=A0A8T0EM67_ARGBR|nr:Epoxide hydrolase 1 like protein [Argiope bruennichi]